MLFYLGEYEAKESQHVLMGKADGSVSPANLASGQSQSPGGNSISLNF